MSGIKTIKREELYQLVWEKPMNKLAKELGLSDVGLAKICNRLGVPRPPQGYWIKKEHGKVFSIPSLPEGDYPAAHTIHPLDPTSYPKTEALEILKILESKPETKIVVPPILENPHPWIAAAQKEFERNSKKTGIISIHGSKCPEISATIVQAPRALRIFNALLRALEERQIKVWLEHGRTWVLFEGVTLQIGLREKLSRRHYTVAEKTEFKKANTYPWYTPPNFVDEPSGKLSFFIREEKEFYNCYSRFVDERSGNLLEERVNDMIIALGRMAEAVRLRRQETEERNARWSEEAKEREVLERLRRQEQQRMDKFTEWADKWHKSVKLAAFLKELESTLKGLPEDHEAREIYKVAHKKLIAMNPLTNQSIQSLRVSEYGHYN